MWNENKLLNINKKIIDRIKTILKNESFNFVINEKNARNFLYFFKIDNQNSNFNNWNDINEYINSISYEEIRNIIHLNFDISTVFYQYVNKIERKSKKNFYDFLLTLPITFFEKLFFQTDSITHDKFLRTTNSLKSIGNEKYNSFKNYFFVPLIKILERSYGITNQKIQVNRTNAKQYRRVQNFDETYFLDAIKSQISECFSIFNVKSSLEFGEFITFIYNVSYQLDYLGIRNQTNYVKYDCFKVLFKTNGIFSKNSELIDNQQILLLLEKNIIFYLFSIQGIRNLVSHGSFILDHKEKLDQVRYYYGFYKPFANSQKLGSSTNWFGQKYNNMCEFEKENNWFKQELDNSILNYMPSNISQPIVDNVNIFFKQGNFFFDSKHWLNTEIFSTLVQNAIKIITGSDFYNAQNITAQRNVIRQIYIMDLEKKFKITNTSSTQSYQIQIDDMLSLISNFSFSLMSKIVMLTPFVSKNKMVDILFNLLEKLKKYESSLINNKFSKIIFKNMLKIFFVKQEWFYAVKEYCITNFEERLNSVIELSERKKLEWKLNYLKNFNYK